jgi:hypothetical protein
MFNFISLSQAFAQWQELAAGIPKDDAPMLSESWNDYTDSLCKDGQLCALQYHYAPSYDDSMPGEGSRYDALSDDREFILDAMGLRMRATRVDARPGSDPTEWDKSASHYRVTLTRNGKSMRVYYSMGVALRDAPSEPDVIHSLLLDASGVDEDFPDWCANLGFDTDSRKAERMYRACERTAASLARLFSAGELSDLNELFEDM